MLSGISWTVSLAIDSVMKSLLCSELHDVEYDHPVIYVRSTANW
jgi:hypothetical protein